MIKLQVDHTFVVKNCAAVSLALIDLGEATFADSSASVQGNTTTVSVRRTTNDLKEIGVLMGVIREFHHNRVKVPF
jgi:hypothetical protein